jgi:hypothetical protein
MPFDKFVDIETLMEERRRAVQESLQSISVAELREIVKELSDFEGDPWQENFLRLIEAHPQESFYRAVTKEGAIVVYCPTEDTGIWVLPGSGMGPLPEQGKRHMKEAIEGSLSGRKIGGKK